MAQLRRPRMMFALVCALGFVAGAHDTAKLSLTTSGAPGSLVITNHGSAEIQLIRAIKIEHKTGDRWQPVEAEFKLVADCAEVPAKADKCVRLASQASLTVVPWTGFSCSGQCNRSCRANVKYPAGRYRFVVASCSDGVAHTSDPFELP
jgi:hypothetical protein